MKSVIGFKKIKCMIISKRSRYKPATLNIVKKIKHLFSKSDILAERIKLKCLRNIFTGLVN
ncbi:hypothetical protein K151_365 [Proteus hauseri ZMd44]|nr:hypothetical protein K151_365 [Proteus hauseri ZMd44]